MRFVNFSSPEESTVLMLKRQISSAAMIVVYAMSRIDHNWAPGEWTEEIYSILWKLRKWGRGTR
jgi:hypothetical protein